jgi:integrase/recombinase XerD
VAPLRQARVLPDRAWLRRDEAICRLLSRRLRLQRTFLITQYGRPFTANGFGNKFKDWCRQAGLPQCSSHGLRKASAAALAEAGATPHEIMAITGHQTLNEVERYTKAARRTKLADEAMAKLRGVSDGHKAYRQSKS